MKKYDVAILGGGPGGYKAAENLAKKGNKVILIEKNQIGGTCLNRGCIPLKTFLYFAKIYDEYNVYMEKEIYKKNSNEIKIQNLLNYKNRIVQDLKKGLESKLIYNNVEMINGEAKIVKKNEENNYIIEIDQSIILETNKIVLAMGSEPVSIFKKENKNFVIDSDYILNANCLPKSILIIGAGVIGLEVASFLNSIGTDVTIIEMTDAIGTEMDKEISKLLFKILQKKNIKIYLNTKVEEITKGEVICNDGKLVFQPELVLEAIGRKAVFSATEMDKIGVQYNNTGILVDENCQTSAEGVYACGDVIGKNMLAHAAYLEADVASAHILKMKKNLDYSKVPMIIYTNPEVAEIGKTEEDCRNMKVEYKKISIPMSYNGRYMIENGKDNAIFKLIYESKTMKILGAHMIGNYSSEIILALETMIYNEMTIDKLKNLIYPHPTVGEIISQAIELIEE